MVEQNNRNKEINNNDLKAEPFAHSDHEFVLRKKLAEMQEEVDKLEQSLESQKLMSFVAGLFQENVTIRTLLEAVSEAVLVCDNEGKILFVNKSFENMFGYEFEDIIGNKIEILLPDRLGSKHTEHIVNYFKRPSKRMMGSGLDLLAMKKNSYEFPVEIGLSYLETAMGIFGLAFITDITYRKEQEKQLKIKIEELQEYANMVAHDLKSSIFALTGYSEVLADSYEELNKQEIKKYLNELAFSSRKMNNIIDELLIFATIKKHEIKPLSLVMKDIITSSLRRVAFLEKERKAVLTIVEPIIDATGYAQWVEEIWYNLITNAIKYGGTPPKIEIGSKEKEDSVMYWVKDNGNGMTDLQVQNIFTNFSRPENPEIKGYGLGLTIVKRILDKLDGKIEITSVVSEGTNFIFYLPKIKYELL